MNNKMVEKATVETQQAAQEIWFLASARAFLQIPNPGIVKVFVLSSLITFTSGIALVIEWICHGKSHTGFGWIIYYALFLMCLPLVILIGLHILVRRGSDQIVDSTTSKEPCVVQNQCTESTKRTEETEKNSCQSLAVVVPPDDEKMPRIKRAVSFPSHGEVRSCRTR
ncbi:uncharacterized protein LOC9316435 [Arabidopsis lyrata subsp. lyrata]|nr:uncharacterized protein LOC9316435 [Arabidopsis lyrata subsp. lyrata]|eukprot:XP_020885004.1 uncharacterized protein LOC9316435 [Arabidopsis lyrata subsp. lyrata]